MIICFSVLDRKATCPRLSPRGGMEAPVWMSVWRWMDGNSHYSEIIWRRITAAVTFMTVY